MRKELEISEPTSCFNKAQDEEPIFVLLGRDAAAAATIRFWARTRIAIGKNNKGDAQIVEAMELADAIELYAKARAFEVPASFTNPPETDE